jgi:hypothetical protein
MESRMLESMLTSPVAGSKSLRRLLVVAHVFAALAISSIGWADSGRPDNVTTAIWLGFASGQIFVCTAWAVLRRAKAWWRWGAVVAPPLFWGWNNGSARGGDYDVWLAYFLPLVIGSAACAAAMRLVNGSRLLDAEEISDPERALRTQFSLRSLMILTAAAAVVCTILKVLVQPWLQFGDEMLPFLAATLLGGTAILMAWFRRDRFGVLRAVTIGAAISAGTSLRLINSPIPFEHGLLLSAIECAVVAATCQAWRASGLRLVPAA